MEIDDNGTSTIWVGNGTGTSQQVTTLFSGVTPLGSSRDGWQGTFTTGGASPQTVANTNVKTTSRILLFPTNAAAAAVVGSATGIYVSTKTADTSFAVTFTPGGGGTFDYIIIAAE